MSSTPTTVFVMRTDDAARDVTVAALRDGGFAVAAFGDESHLYSQVIRLAIAPGAGRRRLVIVTEPTPAVVRDIEMLRSASWRTPLVLVGRDATAEIGLRLGGVCLSCEQPTAEAFERAIAEAQDVAAEARVAREASGPRPSAGARDRKRRSA